MSRTDLGKLIHSRREELGLTPRQLAKRVKRHPSQIYNLEGGQTKSLYRSTAKNLAQALRLKMAVFKDFLFPPLGQNERETASRLGGLIRSSRKELGFTQEELAQKLGVSKQYISQVEIGQRPLNEGDFTLERLAKTLKLDLTVLRASRPLRKMKKPRAENTLGGFLTSQRLKLRLTQREVAKQAGVNQSTVGLIERGITRHPHPELLTKIARALGCQNSC